MSGEFGSYNRGYFHDQIAYAAEDLAGGHDALTREWAGFFEEFSHIARAICWSEACDSGPSRPIMETIRRLPALKSELAKIEAFVRPFEDVADEAVRRKMEKKS